ncbi:hypothetical protein [Streptomyces muensis]|uniref:Uncharacterized protein n=1 Tax=Streptomyces muensis TaxID=1077944 RepID=A0A9X1PRX4_STRM4|nr:hypothetical protein [Streptomyces muensis]MCF1592402.1 hypothetical protein [Streptomyces muensis]
MSKKPRRDRQVRDREIKRLKRERGISHTEAMRIVDAGRVPADAAGLSPYVPPKGLHLPDGWSKDGTPFTPPPGVPPKSDPYGHAHDVGAGAYLLTFTVPDREDWYGTEVDKAVKAIVYAHRFLVRPGVGWYRAHASVYGPIPITVPYSSDAETPDGFVTVTVMVTPYARIGAGLQELIAFMEDSVRVSSETVLGLYPVAAGLEPERLPVELDMADGIRERLEPRDLSWMHRHPTLADHGPAYETYPDRVVDIRARGWRYTGEGRYTVDYEALRDLPERTYDELAAIDGPLSVVEEPNPYNAEDFVKALESAGTAAAASLLVALYQLDAQYKEWSQESGEPSCSLTAGREGSWESETMMAMVQDLGPALAGQPDRFHAETTEALKEELEGWTGMSQHYTEVAENVAVLFSRAADNQGGWRALADQELQAVEPLRTWLMSKSPTRLAQA